MIPSRREKWGTGVDIESVQSFKRAIRSNRFLTRTFSKREIAYCKARGEPAVHFAGIFAVKESAYKASSLLIRKAVVADFEVGHLKSGAPTVRYRGPDIVARSMEIRASISHAGDYAVAVSVARVLDSSRL